MKFGSEGLFLTSPPLLKFCMNVILVVVVTLHETQISLYIYSEK
jgi:hypothetical protein